VPTTTYSGQGSESGYGYWSYVLVTYYQTVYSYSTRPTDYTTTRTVNYPIRTMSIASVNTNKSDPPQKSKFNYWLALISLLPLVGLIAYERKSRSRKQN
jgi:hypothetical protein